jgi:ABC-type uncharacterized transport system substrate-binding protein
MLGPGLVGQRDRRRHELQLVAAGGGKGFQDPLHLLEQSGSDPGTGDGQDPGLHVGTSMLTMSRKIFTAATDEILYGGRGGRIDEVAMPTRRPHCHAPLRPGPARIRRRVRLAAAFLVAAAIAGTASAQVAPRRVLIIDSYHRGYPWSDGIRAGIAGNLALAEVDDDSLASEDGTLVARVLFLDTKRHPARRWSEQRADEAFARLQAWKPDVVIACDDNAVRDLVVPHLLGGPWPVVFCGVNWDAGVYGLPAQNVTGMIEVERVEDLIATLRPHARGDRVGLIVLDTTTGRRDVAEYERQLGRQLTVRLVDDYAGWKRAFVALQDEVDMLLIKQNITGVPDWDLGDAIAFTQAATTIPTGTTTEPIMRCVLVSFIKNPREQGRWAAAAARRILDGASPREIAPAANEESRVFLNMTLARDLGIRFPMALIERATFLEEAWRP